ncbi:hypothetical protein JCR33_01470 [Acuticoccus sp. 2012]|uniref:Uncharacterized protein n=1 Tax=Acuticoccus mangrovi TaxID=2796142 RepID=A0A934IL69_9HYPH|nr:hypothetical protein [Acuticoccus mangrovi]
MNNYLGAGVAVIIAALIEILKEIDPDVRPKFISQLNDAYTKVRHMLDTANETDLQVMRWTIELVSGFSKIESQKLPFLKT